MSLRNSFVYWLLPAHRLPWFLCPWVESKRQSLLLGGPQTWWCWPKHCPCTPPPAPRGGAIVLHPAVLNTVSSCTRLSMRCVKNTSSLLPSCFRCDPWTAEPSTCSLPIRISSAIALCMFYPSICGVVFLCTFIKRTVVTIFWALLMAQASYWGFDRHDLVGFSEQLSEIENHQLPLCRYTH